MRVFLYLREFPPAGDQLVSGMIKAVHGLAAGLVQCGAEVAVLCENFHANHTASPAGYEIRCFAYNRGISSPRSIPDGLVKFLENLPSPGPVIVNGCFSPNVYLVTRVLRRCGLPYVAAPHDPYHPSIFRQNWHLKWPYWYMREKPMLQHAAAVQVLDMRHAQFLRNLGVRTAVIEVLNGYEGVDVHPLEELSWSADGPIKLLYLGRMDYHNKALDILLKAFASICQRHQASLTLQGPDWGDLARMQKLASSLSLDGRVSFRPPQFDVSASYISGAHDIFCLPSRFEGFGLSALEAMLAGRVLLVSEVAGIAPHVKESGCGVVVQSHVQSVREGLEELISRRAEWKQMGLAGREYALRKLTWRRIAQRALDQYRQLFDPTPVGAPAQPRPVAAGTSGVE